MVVLLLLLLDSGRVIRPDVYVADVLECNTVHSEIDGSVTFTQVIAWRFDSHTGTHYCEGYRIVRHDEHRPRRVGCYWRATFGVSQSVAGRAARFSHTTWDPEVEDRMRLPMELRRWR